MAKVLFFSLPLSGHVNPSLGLIRELTMRGDEVVYFATDAFAASINQTGSEFRRYKAAELSDLQGLPERTDELSSWLMNMAERVLETDLDAFRAARPDYVITDSVAPWGQWVAKILGVPLVTSISTMALNGHVMRYAFASGVRPTSASRMLTKLRHMSLAWRRRRRLCHTYRVSGPGVMGSVMGSSDLNLVYTSRQFQPCAETFDSRFQFVGPLVRGHESASFEWGGVNRLVDLIYVSLGTLFNADVSFYRACFEAFGGEPVQVVLSTGSKVSPAEIGVPPPNVIAATHVPQLAVLEGAKVFVTHGGMNSVSESVWCGVPMVVVPQMGEQALVGRRVQQLGAGLYVAKDAVTPATLRAAVRRLLAEPSFRAQTDTIRQSFLKAGGAARAVDAIRAFVSGTPREL